MAGRRELRPQEIKILWGVGAICAFPDCNQWLVEEGTTDDPQAVVGEMAHIVGHSPDGPRGDPAYPKEKLDSAENRILLCPTHHTIVDAQDSTYTVDQLREWKATQERFVRETLASHVRAVGFEELERVTRGLLATPAQPLSDLSPPLTPREKMALNGMTADSETVLSVGYLRSKDVEEYVATTETVEPGYADRLAEGFRSEYRRLKDQNFTGDALFLALAEWSAQGRSGIKDRAAGVAVLTYLFHICDVFES